MLTNTGTILTQASNEWWTRPDDQRFLSLPELHEFTKRRADASASIVLGPDDYAVRVDEDNDTPLVVQTPTGFGTGLMRTTDWSLSQICTRAGVPSRVVKRFASGVPGGRQLMSVALNQGLAHLAGSDEAMLYARVENGTGELAALTGPSYGRIFDHQVVEAVMSNLDSNWQIPSSSYGDRDPRRATTLYASDRDVFIFLVNEQNPIVVRTPDGPRELKRGFYVSNSEVGNGVFQLVTFLYDFVCDNRTIWGAENVRHLRIRHTSGAPERFKVEGRKALDEYVITSTETTQRRLNAAAEFKVGKTEDEVVSWLQGRGFNKLTSKKIVAKANEEEHGAETAWQLANGLTAMARGIKHTDQRVKMEGQVGRILNSRELIKAAA